MIGRRHKFATVYSAIYCSWPSCRIHTPVVNVNKMAELDLEKLLFADTSDRCIRSGITVLNFFIWGGISSVLLSEITFYGSAITVKPTIYLPK